MWVTAFHVLTLGLILAALAYVFSAGRKLRAIVSELQDGQGAQLRRIERDLDRVRQALDSISTGVMTIDIRQRLKKG